MSRLKCPFFRIPNNTDMGVVSRLAELGRLPSALLIDGE